MLSRPFFALFALLLVVGVIRLLVIGYGLPLHLYADEEVNVYSALRMIHLQTLLPVLHPDAFAILYEPPLLAYLYTFLFLPTTAFFYLLQGIPSFTALADHIVLDPSIFFLAGRALTVFISLGSIYLVYEIGRRLFTHPNVGIFAAIFLATSFTHTALSVTTRHWEVSTFLSLISLLCILLYREKRSPWLSVAAGAALGLSFGAGYLVFYAPCIGLILLASEWKRHRNIKKLIRPALLFGISFTTIAVLFIAVAPYPFSVQVLNHVSSQRHTIEGFLTFYSQTLIFYETPLFIGSLLGVVALIRNRALHIAGFFAVFFLTVLPIMYVFLWDLDRYIHPLLPVLALLAAYGISSLPRRVAIGAGIALIIYAAFLLPRLDLLAIRNDTRVAAHEWILANIPEGSTILVDSERLRLPSSPAAVSVLEATDPSIIRAPDRITSSPLFDSYHIYLAVGENTQRVIEAASKGKAEMYVVTDSWSDTKEIKELVEGQQPIAVFSGHSSRPTPLFLFIGGEEHYGARQHILALLWSPDRFGPDVRIYVVTKNDI